MDFLVEITISETQLLIVKMYGKPFELLFIPRIWILGVNDL